MKRTSVLVGGLPLVGALLAAAIAPAHAGAQLTRSREIGARPSDKGDVVIGTYYFAGVGINHYGEPWVELDNAVSDVDSVRTTLVDEFHFESPDEWVLRDTLASKAAIEHLIDELSNRLGENDNLIFFYAGHGAEQPIELQGEVVGRAGYIVPASVKAPLKSAQSQYIRISDLLDRLAELPSRHVLVILDSCYSGIALGGIKSRGGGAPAQAEELMGRQSRRVLTSAMADQTAADGGSPRAGNSLFTGWLTEGLRRAARGDDTANTADMDDNGVITATELYSFVSQIVSAASEARQTPAYGAFSYDDRGEMVLFLESDAYQEAYDAAIAAFDEDKLEPFGAALSTAVELAPDDPRTAYLRYLEAQFDDLYERGDEATRLAKSVEVLRTLVGLAEAGESFPVPGNLLNVQLTKATRACRKAGCPAVEGDQ